MSSRKRYRPRPVVHDTLALALHHAAKPAREDRQQVLQVLIESARALRQGVATELQWSIVAGSLDVALAIERQGVVRGLAEHLAAAEQALQAIYDRARSADGWTPPALHFNERDAVQTFVDLHVFQVNQLGRAELLRAIDSAAGQIRANGGRVTLVRDVEGVAA